MNSRCGETGETGSDRFIQARLLAANETLQDGIAPVAFPATIIGADEKTKMEIDSATRKQ